MPQLIRATGAQNAVEGEILVRRYGVDAGAEWEMAAPGISAPATDVQVFTANGTWTKPATAASVQVRCWGAGGGGGAGARYASGTLATGGGGGSAGGYAERWYRASDLTATVAITCASSGGAGAGGVAIDSTGGGAGAGAASASVFGLNGATWGCTAFGGAGGAGGTNSGSAAGGTGAQGSSLIGGAGGASSASGGAGVGGVTVLGPAAGGGSGGGITTGAAQSAGGAGGISQGQALAATAGTAGGGAGSSGANFPGVLGSGGGGAGGGSNTAGAGGAGGNGGNYGGGGGGGGASLNGNASGAGGNGAPGLVVVTSFDGTSGSGSAIPPASSIAGPETWGGPPVVGVSNYYARGDHLHGLPPLPQIPTASTTVVGPDFYGTPPNPGSSILYARGDHDHGLPAASPGTPPAIAFVTPAAPTGTTSTTLVMAGLAIAFTPSSTGKILILINGLTGTAGSPQSVQMQLNYGTGTAPANGAVNIGTRSPQGTLVVYSAAAATRTPFSLVGTLSGLGVGTAYWCDIAFQTSNVANQANLANLAVTIQEVS